MALIDSLLKLIALRGADALIVESDGVPFLLKGSDELPLKMPPLDAEVVTAMLAATSRTDGAPRATYESDSERFEVVIASARGGHRLTFRPGMGRPAPSGTTEMPRIEPPLAQASGHLAELLDRAARMGASDVFFSTSAPACARVSGALRALDTTPASEADLLSVVSPGMSEAEREAFEQHGSADVGLSAAGARYRVNLFKQNGGLAAAFRPINTRVPTLLDLHLPTSFHELTAHRHGLVLMAGTAGSGKSTTLVSLVEHLNRNSDKHIVTLEDPIEYVYAPRRCLIHQREVGRHVSSFQAGLRAALRESPDVILLGEMRDRETIAAALTAAETGHLVLSTIHSASAAMAIDRIIDVFSEHQQTQVRYQLANVLRAIVTQTMLPSPKPPGRVVAFERVNVTAAVSTKIRENRTHQIETEIQRGRAEGMVPFELSLADLAKQRLLSSEVAAGASRDPSFFAQLLREA
ncbi:MAG: PilT/PilU family type 4a pilus ATPase [Myxococcales bacterium]|nr:PilT/PilU family type 4a pilus ATPase [Myxococcales bacterium]